MDRLDREQMMQQIAQERSRCDHTGEQKKLDIGQERPDIEQERLHSGLVMLYSEQEMLESELERLQHEQVPAVSK